MEIAALERARNIRLGESSSAMRENTDTLVDAMSDQFSTQVSLKEDNGVGSSMVE